MSDTYTRINWKEAPSTQTPISAENLNKMDKGIKDAHNKYDNLSENVANLRTEIGLEVTNIASLVGGEA